MANGAKPQNTPTNGVLTGGPGNVGGNRKKAKRRAKQAAKLAAEQPETTDAESAAYHEQASHEGYDHQDAYYSDPDDEHYAVEGANGHYDDDSKSVKKKRKSKGQVDNEPVQQPAPPSFSHATLKSVTQSANSRDKIWNTSTQEERENIKEFWVSLTEDARKSLVKIEKEAVLRKMKEQQKHSCSCTVCGRKRTAIEEELEVLYDAYYEELEQLPSSDGLPRLGVHSRTHGTVEEIPDAEEYDEEEEDEESDEGSDEEEDDEYSDDDDDEIAPLPRGSADFFNFGNSLTVKGGILTVADDLLKNDGKKFIEMMEQLAERRMKREEQIQNRPNDPPISQHAPPGDLPDEEDYDDDEEYDEESEGDYEEEEMDAMTEEQRMEEGRRMFQIFAARMFEQRVLTAYREKVALERQRKLLEELEEEDRADEQKEAKKARDAQKKKDKRAQAKQAKAEEKARKDAEKARELAEAKAAEEKRLEEQRKRREEQRRKKESEKKAQEEERLRKEAEAQRRKAEQKERQLEAERKQQEQRALEKKSKEDAKRKQQEEREAKAREREEREKKSQESKAQRELEIKAKAEMDSKEKGRKDDVNHSNLAQSKRTVQPVAVALPPGLMARQNSSVASPQVQVATPSLPKAPTPNRPRQMSQHESHGSSPVTPQAASGVSKPVSPTAPGSTIQPVAPNKTPVPRQPMQPAPVNTHSLQPAPQMPPIGPPGFQQPHNAGFPGAMPPSLNGFHPHGPMQGGSHRPGMQGLPMFPPHHQGPMPGQYRGFNAPGGGLPPPPGMGVQPMMPPHGQSFGLPPPPPGFQSQHPSMTSPMPAPGFRDPLPVHSRQPSASFEKPSFDNAIGPPPVAPIQRPGPIGRPTSVKPHDDGSRGAQPDVDDLSDHLGSKALLDDVDDDPLASYSPADLDSHRGTGPPGGLRDPNRVSWNSPMYTNQPSRPRVESFGLINPIGAATAWGSPTMPFGASPTSGNIWGNAPGGAGGFFSNPGFGNPMGQTPRLHVPRPVTLRLKAILAFRELAPRAPPQGVPLEEVHHHIARNSPQGDGPAHLDETKAILETEGDVNNGGGLFNFEELPTGQTFVRFEEMGDSHPKLPSGLGEIGSPLPSHSVPVGNFPIGTRLPNLGPS